SRDTGGHVTSFKSLEVRAWRGLSRCHVLVQGGKQQVTREGVAEVAQVVALGPVITAGAKGLGEDAERLEQASQLGGRSPDLALFDGRSPPRAPRLRLALNERPEQRDGREAVV